MRWKPQRSWRRADYGKSRQGIQLGVGRETALITRDTKCPEELDLYLLPSCNFVSFVVVDRQIEPLPKSSGGLFTARCHESDQRSARTRLIENQAPALYNLGRTPSLTPLPPRPPRPNRAAGTIWPPVCLCSRSH